MVDGVNPRRGLGPSDGRPLAVLKGARDGDPFSVRHVVTRRQRHDDLDLFASFATLSTNPVSRVPHGAPAATRRADLQAAFKACRTAAASGSCFSCKPA